MPRSVEMTGLNTPAPGAVVELLKPITWFPPMWAFGCGVACTTEPLAERWPLIIAGIILTGPLVCATSQIVNDWYDRDVDAINEPYRPIPSGRVPGTWGFWLAILWTLMSLCVAALLGLWVLVAAVAGLAFAWAYSAPPIRLKKNGWIGNAAVGACYEGLPWLTGAAVMTSALPSWQVFALAGLYSFGAHGIMTLNDFKSIEGDRRMGIGSLPVRLGELSAARVACAMMALPQAVVVALLVGWNAPWHAVTVAALLALQLALMLRFLQRPRERALWYSALGINFFVLGMLASAFALRASEGLR